MQNNKILASSDNPHIGCKSKSRCASMNPYISGLGLAIKHPSYKQKSSNTGVEGVIRP